MQTREISPVIKNLFDPDALTRGLQDKDCNQLTLVKEAVTAINDGLQKYYHAGTDVNDIVYGRSWLTDQLLASLYQHFFSHIDQRLSLIAVGGYGRGELHPKSDIDLMLLLKDEENDATKDRIEQFLMLLWDSRLEIGHSVRTLQECVDEAEKDITVVTNIMEARLLAGDENLFTEMKHLTGPDKIWDSKAFFLAKLDEQIQRNGKFNDTAYNLEPNIKESHGGLRDIQMIAWVAKRHFNADSLEALVKNGFLLEDEYKCLCDGQHLLWRIRCSLHYLANRREDRLLFDYQRELANELGFEDDPDSPGNQVIEQLMQNYYRTVKQLEQLNEILLQYFREAIIYADEPGTPDILNEHFQVIHGYLETRSEDTFKTTPDALLELFLVLEEHTDIQGVRASTIREIKQNLPLIDDDFRQSAQAKKLFMKIITHTRGITHELRRMNRYDVLSAYIPAFDSIVGRMQYDLFHAYTVDQHTLFVIRNMRRLSVPDFCHEFPLASGIFQHIKKPHLLYLAGLFHDIAKGRGGDHSELGAVDAYEFCIDHNLSEKDADLVSWLVASHLIMSITAQRQDLSDPDVISSFAKKVKDITHLDYLYLLTMSDIRATNPKQWNSWKDKLLAELYHKTASLINNGLNNLKDKFENIAETQTNALRQLEQLGILPQQTHSIWNNFSNSYFQDHNSGEIVWHTSLIAGLDASKIQKKPLVATRVDMPTNSIELMVYMPSRDGIFFNIVSLLSNCGMDIVNAHIVNCHNQHALETFRLISANIDDTELEHAAEDITLRLTQRLDEHMNSPLQATDTVPVMMKPLRTNKHFDSPTEITFKVKNNLTRVKIETINQTGILAYISRIFSEHGVTLLSAHIHTAGEKAIDYFYITNQDDSALSHSMQEKLKTSLLEQL